MNETKTKPSIFARTAASLRMAYASVMKWFASTFNYRTKPVEMTAEAIADMADKLATTVQTVAGDVGPVLTDVQVGLDAAKPFTGVVSAVVPGAGQALAIASEAVALAEDAVKDVGVVTTVVLAVAADATKLEDATQAVKAVIPTAIAAQSGAVPIEQPPGQPGDAAVPSQVHMEYHVLTEEETIHVLPDDAQPVAKSDSAEAATPVAPLAPLVVVVATSLT